jgi:DNA modification methylase
VLHGDCTQVMREMESASVDFILTDPPYICRYNSRDGQTVANDDNADWLEPSFAEMCRLLKPGTFCISFYGWTQVDKFVRAWRSAGFRKRYASSSRFTKHFHLTSEAAF